MKRLLRINWPALGLIFYLVALLIAGLVYWSSQRKAEPFFLTGVTRLPQSDGGIRFALRGSGLGRQLQASLTFDTTNRHAVVGSLPIWGQTVDVDIVDSKAYVVSRTGGVMAFDLKVPGAPVRLGQLYDNKSSWQGSVYGNYYYLSSATSGLSVYNLVNQHVAFRLQTHFGSFATVKRDSLLFVADGRDGVTVYDVSGNVRARELANLPLKGNTWNLALYGDFLLAASQTGGLNLIDIRDPTHPVLLQNIPSSRGYFQVTRVGDFVYAAEKDKKINVFSLSSGGRLKLVSSLPLYGTVHAFLLDKAALYLAEFGYGVSKLDVSDPTSPRRVGYVGTPGVASALALYGDYLYVASGSQGVQIIDKRRFVPRQILAEANTPGAARDIVLDGRWLYVADGDAGLQVLQKSGENELGAVANLPLDGTAAILAKSQGYLYVADSKKGLFVVDIRNPLLPQIIGRISLGANIIDMRVGGSSLFVSSSEKKLLRFDIGNPRRPQLAESLGIPHMARRLALAGDHILLAAVRSGMQVVDFTPGKPGRILFEMSRPWPMNAFAQTLDVTVRGDYAYLVQGEDGLQVVDISDPHHPQEVGFLTLPGQLLSIDLADEYAVLSTRWNGYLFVDISDPRKPILVARLALPGSKNRFKVENGLIYSAGHARGVSVVPLPLRCREVAGAADIALRFVQPKVAGWYDLNVSNGQRIESVSSVLSVE